MAKGKAVIRSLGSVDAVEISARQAPAGAMYDVYAVQNSSAPYGKAVKLAHVMVKPDGTIDAAAQLQFFASGFVNVVIAPEGALPAGASLSTVSIPVLELASANHCSMH